jgi:acetyltransferase
MSFAPLFHPRAIAIIGASQDATRIGGQPVRALQKAGYTGGLYPVNPNRAEIAGLKCYADIGAVPKPCDLAIVAVPAPGVADAIRACGRAGVPTAIVLTAGFRESGSAGAALEAELKEAAREARVRMIGPNCMGMISLADRVWAVFGGVADEPGLRIGHVSCAFQSGGFGYAIVNLAEQQGVGFRFCLSTGNETDVAMPELLSAFLDDEGTHLAFGVMEGTPDARALLAVGQKAMRLGKPLLIWKAANTDIGARAAASHTGNLTGSYDLYRAAFRQSGIIEVDDVEPIVDIAKLVAHRRLPAGPRVGVLSISGGSGIVFADRAVRRDLEMPSFAPATAEALRQVIPAFGSIENPADVTAGVFNDIGLFTKTIETVLADPGIDQVAVLLASMPGTPALKAAEAIIDAARSTSKPIFVGWSGRRSKSEEAYQKLEAADIPIIPTPVRLAEAMGKLTRFALDRRRLAKRSPVAFSGPRPVLPNSGGALSEVASKALLARFGVPFSREVVVASGADADAATAALSPPFAVKIVSPVIAHKTEAGGVMLGVERADLDGAIARVTANAQAYRPSARIDGVLIAEMAAGVEMLVGVVNDPAFGPAVALGLGGVTAEALHDVTHRIAPFDLATAHDMIGELRGAVLLGPWRGYPARDVDALARLLVDLGHAAMAIGPRLAEIDLNPVFVRAAGEGVVAADALVVLHPPTA